MSPPLPPPRVHSLRKLLTNFAEGFSYQPYGFDQVGVKSGDKSGAAAGTRRQSSAAAEPEEEAAPPQDAPKQTAGFEARGGVLEAVPEAPPGLACPTEDDKEDVSRSDEFPGKDIVGREQPGNKASDTSAGPVHRRPNSGDSSNSAETVGSSGAREDTSCASSSSSRGRTLPDEDAALREGRAAQVLSEGGDEEPMRDLDTALPASDEKGAHSNDNAEEATDAEITGIIEREGKGTQDAKMGKDTSMQSQREGDESVVNVTRTGTKADRSASKPHAATIVTSTKGKDAQESGHAVQQATDLEMSGSVEGSEQSRWSLPSGGGIGGVGGVREERAVWAGLADAEDSMGSAEQAPSSISGERGADGKSPRSRVESYDLQQGEVSPDVRWWFIFGRDVFKSASGAMYMRE